MKEVAGVQDKQAHKSITVYTITITICMDGHSVISGMIFYFLFLALQLLLILQCGNWKSLILPHKNSFVATPIFSASWHMLWTLLYLSLLPSLVTFMLWSLCTLSKWFGQPHFVVLPMDQTSVWLMHATASSKVALCHPSAFFCAVCGIVQLVMFTFLCHIYYCFLGFLCHNFPLSMVQDEGAFRSGPRKILEYNRELTWSISSQTVSVQTK